MAYADKPWLKSYKLGPYKLEHSLTPYPEEPVYKILDVAAEKHPGQTAVRFLDRKITYRELPGLQWSLPVFCAPMMGWCMRQAVPKADC